MHDGYKMRYTIVEHQDGFVETPIARDMRFAAKREQETERLRFLRAGVRLVPSRSRDTEMER